MHVGDGVHRIMKLNKYKIDIQFAFVQHIDIWRNDIFGEYHIPVRIYAW